jgi:hypothetical protein
VPGDATTFDCPDCGRQVTRGPSGVEYGHERGRGETGASERCEHRPDAVDPRRPAPHHEGWCTGPGSGGASP